MKIPKLNNPLKMYYWIVNTVSTSVIALLTVALLVAASPAAYAMKSDTSDEDVDDWQVLAEGFIGKMKKPKNSKKNKENYIAAMDLSSYKIKSLWLRTGVEGLYVASIADLAAGLNKKEKNIRKNAKKGKLGLLNEGDIASWYFDSVSDNIYFVGETYDTLYTGQNAYHFFRATGKKSKAYAQPMDETDDTPTGAVGTPAPFSDTLRFEEEPGMEAQALFNVKDEENADYFFWARFFTGGPPLDVPLEIPNPVAGDTAQLRITMRGFSDLTEGDDHYVAAKLNTVSIGAVLIWDGFDEATLVADIDSSLLDPGGANILTLENVSPTPSGVYLNYVEVDYLRYPVAFNESLWLHDVAAGVQKVTSYIGGNILVIESPATDDATVRKDAAVTFNGSDYDVTFETPGGKDYLVVEQGSAGLAVVEPNIPSSLLSKKNKSDYLIISPRDFAGAAIKLANYRYNRFGHIKIVWLDDIYDVFAHGRVDPFAITRFIDHVETVWKKTPDYGVFMGKGTTDHKDRDEYGDSFIPPVFASTPWFLAPSDDRLLGGDNTAPFAFSRLPIVDNQEGEDYVDKLMDYENSSANNEAVLIADNPDIAGDFHTNSDFLANRLDSLASTTSTKYYHQGKYLNFPDAPVANPLFNPGVVRGFLTQSATWEAAYHSYDGHGSHTRMGGLSGAAEGENFIHVDDVVSLTNSEYGILSALTCLAGGYELPGTRSLAGALVLNPTGGIVAAFSPTGFSLDAEAQTIGNAFVDSLFGSNDTIGNAAANATADPGLSTFMSRIYAVLGEPALYLR